MREPRATPLESNLPWVVSGLRRVGRGSPPVYHNRPRRPGRDLRDRPPDASITLASDDDAGQYAPAKGASPHR
jgi:hypothetical protein